MTKEFFERGKQIAKWADNNMTKDEALKMAYDWLNEYAPDEVVQACKEALEQPTLTYEDGFAHGYEAHRAEQALEQLKEPQYLYVSKGVNGKPELSFIDHQESIGKILLIVESNDDL